MNTYYEETLYPLQNKVLNLIENQKTDFYLSVYPVSRFSGTIRVLPRESFQTHTWFTTWAFLSLYLVTPTGFDLNRFLDEILGVFVDWKSASEGLTIC